MRQINLVAMSTNNKQVAKSVCRASNNIYVAGKSCKRLNINSNSLSEDINTIGGFFDADASESFLLAGIIYNRLSCDDSMSVKDILNWLCLNIDSAPDIQETLNSLYKKGIIGRETSRWERKEPQYYLTSGAYQAVISGRKDQINTNRINSFLDLLQRVYQLYSSLKSDKCEVLDYFLQMEHLTERYNCMPEIEWLKAQDLSDCDEIILLTSAGLIASNPNQNINVGRIIRQIDQSSLQTIHELVNQAHPLLKKNLLEFCGTDFSEVDEMRLSKISIDGFRLEIKSKPVSISNLKYGTVLLPEQIEKTEIFINKNEQKQLDAFEKIYKRWFPLGMPADEISNTMRSIKVLMEGPSGVGKSQSVLNFAKRNELAIYEARASQLKDMWVGSTEKAYEGIFTEFKLVQEMNAGNGRGTIMVINELEGILASRIKSESSVNFMISSATSIFLKEMEKFRGVMITTCNQSKGFIDDASYRRFNFKIIFDEPSYESRVAIAKGKFPTVSGSFIIRLCQEFKLRGGQLQNVYEKFRIMSLAEEGVADEAMLWELCQQEVDFQKKPSSIGFSIR